MATGNSTLQLGADPAMRGRVMSLWFVAFQGSTPIGGPIVGATMAILGARAGLGLGAITCLIVAFAGLIALERRRARSASVELQDLTDGAESLEEPVDVRRGVVHGERRARRGAHPQPAHQRLRAMVTRAHADSEPS